MYKVKTEKFEGPLDLLLELIESEKLDITEISLSKITDKYLDEVSGLDPKNFDVAEFLVVAARLIYLKSKALLPSIESPEEEKELEDLRDKLEIYKKYKDAAREFSSILTKNQRSFSSHTPKIKAPTFTPPHGVELDNLWNIFNRLLRDMPQELTREEVAIPSEKITIEDKLAELESLTSGKKKLKFSKIIGSAKSKLEAIVTFLAILEMVKCKQIRVNQNNNFSDIELVGSK